MLFGNPREVDGNLIVDVHLNDAFETTGKLYWDYGDPQISFGDMFCGEKTKNISECVSIYEKYLQKMEDDTCG